MKKVPYWDVLLNLNWAYPPTLRTTVEQFMNVYVVDLTKDDENVNSQPFMRDPVFFCFVPKQFRKHRLKPVKEKGIT